MAYTDNMKRIWIIKILYYFFFTIIISMAVVIFMEIIDFPFYDQYLAGFFRKIINAFNF